MCRREATTAWGRAEVMFVATHCTKQHRVAALHGSVCCQVPCLLLCSLWPMHTSCCWGAKCYCWCTEVMLILHDWDISNMCRSVPSVISSVSSQEFPFFPSSVPKQDLPEIWILNLQVGSCVAVWEWLYTEVYLQKSAVILAVNVYLHNMWYVTVKVQSCLQYRNLIFYCKRKLGWLTIVTVLQAGWCGFDCVQEQEIFLFS